jgi:hypothetical protein
MQRSVQAKLQLRDALRVSGSEAAKCHTEIFDVTCPSQSRENEQDGEVE